MAVDEQKHSGDVMTLQLEFGIRARFVGPGRTQKILDYVELEDGLQALVKLIIFDFESGVFQSLADYQQNGIATENVKHFVFLLIF